MSERFAPLALALTPLIPAVFAMLSAWRPTRAGCVRLAPLAFFPAFAAVLPQSSDVWLGGMLLGTHLSLDPTGRMFLLLSAVTWTIAAMFARAWLADDPSHARFFGFFFGAAAGNLGICIAHDVVSFYSLFALMTFSAWGLVLHRRTAQAYRAGRIYIALAVLGEAALLAALLLIAASGVTELADVPAAVANSSARDVIVMLLLIGFGVKTGVIGLHVSLPLAYGATPAPGAAILASAMIKAGLMGWLRFLPLGQDLPGWDKWFVMLGAAAAFHGVVVGLLQREPKVILAYSSVSQMGLIMIGVGAAFAGPGAHELALSAVAVYAVHHAFAKESLFLGEALSRVARSRHWVLAGLALSAAALAGAPFTSGALAKHMLKDAVAPMPWADVLSNVLAAAAVGTTLIMCRFLWCVWRAPHVTSRGATGQAVVPWGLSLGAVLATGFILQWPAVSLTSLIDATWPVLLGVALAIGAAQRVRTSLQIPPGDILVPLERVLIAARKLSMPRMQRANLFLTWPAGSVERIERTLRSWNVVGLLLFLLLGLLLLMLAVQ